MADLALSLDPDVRREIEQAAHSSGSDPQVLANQMLRRALVTHHQPPAPVITARVRDQRMRAALERIDARLAQCPPTGLVADKAFFDDLSGNS